jgi:F-type H+-transporting ATPase subunit b
MRDKKWIILALLIAPVLVFGAEHAEAAAAQYEAVAGRSTDFIPRIFNFLVFAGLAYYLVASPLKAFFVGRRDGIADQLNEIERKLQEAKAARKRAEQALEESKSKAREILSDSEKEMALLKEKYVKTIAKDLDIMEKQYEEKCELEERKMVRETIDHVLNEHLTSDDIPMGADQVINIVAKKVA